MTYTNKTQPTKISPEKFLIKNFKGKEKIQKEALVLVDLYSKVTGSPCVMWNKIFGFGKYHYLDSKGGEHTHLITGFAVSSTGFTLYNMIGWEGYKKDIEKIVVAYEPLWAIGGEAKRSATKEEVEEIAILIRRVISDTYGFKKIPQNKILYGGSVGTKKDIANLFSKNYVDGFLVGRASLSAKTFVPLVEEVHNLNT